MPQLFGEKLRVLRLQQNLTQAALARRIDAKRSHINNLEVSRRAPSLELVLQIADLFKVSTDYLLRDSIPVEPSNLHLDKHLPNHGRNPRLLGSKLSYLRQQRNLTQSELAQRVSVASRGYIGNLENDRKVPAPDLVPVLADVLGVTTDYLLQDSIPIELNSLGEGANLLNNRNELE